MSLEFPRGIQRVGVAAAMLAILLLRPSGLTGGRELAWPKFAGLVKRMRRRGRKNE
jgi:hypothetical protein